MESFSIWNCFGYLEGFQIRHCLLWPLIRTHTLSLHSHPCLKPSYSYALTHCSVSYPSVEGENFRSSGHKRTVTSSDFASSYFSEDQWISSDFSWISLDSHEQTVAHQVLSTLGGSFNRILSALIHICARTFAWMLSPWWSPSLWYRQVTPCSPWTFCLHSFYSTRTCTIWSSRQATQWSAQIFLITTHHFLDS